METLSRRTGNMCPNPDLLGFCKNKWFWVWQKRKHEQTLSFKLDERFWGCLKSHATIPREQRLPATETYVCIYIYIYIYLFIYLFMYYLFIYGLICLLLIYYFIYLLFVYLLFPENALGELCHLYPCPCPSQFVEQICTTK